MQILGHFIIRVIVELFIGLFALEVVSESKVIDPASTAKALSALGAILILGLGGVLMIAMSGRWIRRWIFPKENRMLLASPDAQLGKLNWAKPASKDSQGSDFPQSDSPESDSPECDSPECDSQQH